MLSKGLRRADDVAAVFCIDPTVLLYWEEHKFLLPAKGYAQRYYANDVLNEWLAVQSRNFATPPTFDDLYSGRIILLQAEVVADRLGVTTHWLGRLVETKRLAAIKLMHEYRYDEASVEARIAGRNDKVNVLRSVAEHILGVSRHTINRLVEERRLDKEENDPRRSKITRQSLLVLLRELLYFGDPRDWMDDRLATKRPLMSVYQVAYNGADMPRIAGLVRASELNAIRHAVNGRPLISPDAVLAYVERTEKPLTYQEIAHIFVVDRRTIYNWRKTDWLACPTHEHPDEELYYSCMLGFLGKWLTKRSSPMLWYQGRMDRPDGVVDMSYAEHFLDTDRVGVVRLIDEEGLFGLHLPNGDWRFMTLAVRRARDIRNARRKAAKGVR